MFYCLPSLILLIIIHIILDLQLLGSCSIHKSRAESTGLCPTTSGRCQHHSSSSTSIATIDIFRLLDNDNDSIAAIVLPHEGSITTRQLPELPIRNPVQLSHSAIPNNPCCAESPIDSGSSQYHGIPISLGTERMGRAPVYQSRSRQSSSRERFSQHSY